MKTRIIFSSTIFIALVSTFIQPVLAESGFTDVNSSHPNYTAISQLKAVGIVEGYTDGSFRPDQEVNRVEALKVILLGAGIDVSESDTTSSFSDTDPEAWYMKYINKAVELGIVQGYPEGTFKPAQTINLVEALKVTQLTFGIDVSQITVSEDPYVDAYADEWYSVYVQYAKDKNLIEADSKNKVYPAQNMTRGTLVELIYRLIFVKDNEVEAYDPKEDPAITEDDILVDNSIDLPVLQVNIENSNYKPDEMIAGVGWTVKWTNNDSTTHTVTSDTALFDSGDMEEDDTFEYVFNSTGSYAYHCDYHPSMTGIITVKPANEVPTI